MKTLSRERVALIERFKSRCFYCGAAVSFDPNRPAGVEIAVADHLVPRVEGGGGGLNLVLACFRCNSSKSGRSLLDWLESGTRRVRRWRSFAEVLAS